MANQIPPGLKPALWDILWMCRKGEDGMKKLTGFWFGMGAGTAAGMILGMLVPMGRRSMKTGVGKRIQRVGVAVDHTVDQLLSNLH